MSKRFAKAFVLLTLVSQSAFAEPEVADALKQMAGAWTGSLVYRDYQSDKRVSIPHRKVVHSGPDGEYALHQDEFTDPGYRVFSAQLFRIAENTLSIASTTENSIEVESFSIDNASMTPSGWSLTATGPGSDNDQPAAVRMLINVSEQRLEIERRVKIEGELVYQFRNAVRLERER